MANVWFMSDAHLDHKNICSFRDQFSSVEEHNGVIKENYHKVVTKRDVVFMLGDMCFTKEALADVKTWTAEKKILICGNHDLERGVNMQDLCNTYDAVYSLHKYKGMWLSHAPIHPQELRGKFNVHGHMHFEKIDDDRYLNVCMEHTNYTPIDLNEVRKRLNINEGGLQMSICRWSSMDWQCDLYCYESEYGYVTHVASSRVVGDIPKVDNHLFSAFSEENAQEFFRQHKAQMEFLENTKREPIGLKYDGQTFSDDKETFLDTLNMLRNEGYKFPEITREDLE